MSSTLLMRSHVVFCHESLLMVQNTTLPMWLYLCHCYEKRSFKSIQTIEVLQLRVTEHVGLLLTEAQAPEIGLPYSRLEALHTENPLFWLAGPLIICLDSRGRSKSHVQVSSLNLQVSSKSQVSVVRIKQVKSSPCCKSKKTSQVIAQVKQVTSQVIQHLDTLLPFLQILKSVKRQWPREVELYFHQ